MADTERRAQIMAERAEQASIVASSHDAIVGVTQLGVVSSCNPAASRLYGYVPSEILGKSAELLVPPALREAEAAVLRRIVAGEEVERYRTDRLCSDGTVVTVSMTVSPIVARDGVIVGVATVSRRASDQEDARDRFEARVDQQRAEIRVAEDRFQVGMDAERAKERADVEAAQERFQDRMDGVRARERVLVQEAEDRFQVGMDAERAKERADVQAAQERFLVGMDAERVKERGEVQEAEDRFQIGMDAERVKERSQSRDAEDRFQVGIDRERAEAQSDRDNLESQLQQSQRLEVLGQLAGGVAHDFNNLLAVILNYAAFVMEEVADPPADMTAVGRDVGQIQRAAQRATALTHQLLAFARREVVQPRVLDLNDVVADLEQLLRRTIGEDIVLQTDLATDLWPVLADPGQIEQVLVNLAVNARDAMAAGGTLTIDTANLPVATVAVDTANLAADADTAPDGNMAVDTAVVAADADDVAADTADSALDAADADSTPAGLAVRRAGHVRLRVLDTGIGMPVEVIEHAFEPFFTTKKDGTGTGLGLATAYGVVTQAGGTIKIRSRPGIGTTFTILIPVTEEAATRVKEPSSYQRTPKGETILVVEDEEALREVTRRIFTRAGYLVITAVDGPEAIILAAQHDGEIHLLLTDVVMPHMLGKQVAERIREDRPDVQVLYMSGYAQPILASQGRLDPGVHLIEKPFTAKSLLAKAGQILNGHFEGFHTTGAGGSAIPSRP